MAVSITTLGTDVYAEDFDSLASTGTTGTTVPAGWVFSEAGTNANSSYGVGPGSNNAGNTYSFGATGSSDRAFGGLQSGSLTPTIGASFTNNTGATITSLRLAYMGEQWRRGTTGPSSGADQLDFQYSLNASSLTDGSWLDVNGLDLIGPVSNATSAGQLNGNAASNRVAVDGTISGLALAPGATIWIRWSSFDISGADDGLAIDDFKLSASGIAAGTHVNLSVSRNDGSEADGTVITVTATASQVLGSEATVIVSVGGSGIDAADFALSGTILTIPAGQISGSVVFTVLNDSLFEGTETAVVSIGSPSAGIELGGTVQQSIVIADDDPPTPSRIHEIQGAGHLSPLAGQAVYRVQGIVTAIASNGFYLQDPQPDANPATSEGIFVFTGSPSALLSARSVGEALLVSGTVQEFRPGGATSGNLTTTELVGQPGVLSLSVQPWTDAPAGGIAAVVLGVDRHPPGELIHDDFALPTSVDSGGDFDPATEGIDFWESLEGMWVQVNEPVAVSPTLVSGTADELWVLADGGTAATGRTARGGVAVSEGDFNPERLQLDDLNSATTFPVVDVGATLASIAGVIDYAGGNFELRVPTAPVVTAPSPLDREITALGGGGDWLRVATFNVENLDPGDPDSKFGDLADAIVKHLLAPEILSLEEVQDNSGAANDGTVDASQTLQDLVDAIVAAGGPRYEWRQIDPAPGNPDGGEPGGNIRQVLLFNPAAGVTFVEGSLQRLLDGDLSDGDAFANSRKPLVAQFSFNGETLTVISNHFNSKGSDDPLFGVIQPPALVTEATRVKQAGIVAGHVEGLLAADPGALVVVAGDLNDFEFSPPLTRLEQAGLLSLIETLPENERYTYNFQGNAQVLDHLMASPALVARLQGFDVVHINSEFASQVSDHDPVLARFFIERPGEVYNGTKSRDTIVGTAGADLITGGAGRDDITTGDGNDVLVLSSVLDGLDLVRDFEPGRDRIDIGPLLAAVGYRGSDPIGDGLVLLQSGTGRSTLLFDVDGADGAGVPRPIVELTGVVNTSLATVLGLPPPG